MTCSGFGLARASSVSSLDEVGDPLDQGVFEPLAHRPAAPPLIPRIRPGPPRRDTFGDGQQRLGGVGIEVQHHSLDLLLQLGRDVLVDGELARVDYPHVHAVPDGVVEEDGVMASRTGSLPRKEKETLETPPEIAAWAGCVLCRRPPR